MDGKIYTIGGNVKVGEEWPYLSMVEVYDPTTNTWTTRVDMPTPRAFFATAVANGRVYAIGGVGTANVALATVEEYNPITNEWTTKTSMPTPRHDLAAAVVNERIYAIGGWDTGPLGTVEGYDPVDDKWVSQAPMPTARGILGVVAVGTKIYAIGGLAGTGEDYQYLATVEEFAPETNQWRSRADMPTPRWGHVAVVRSGRIFALGGRVGGMGEVLDTVEVYIPGTDKWFGRPNMPTRRRSHAAAVVDGKIYVLGGWNDIDIFASMDMLDLIPNDSHMARVIIRVISTSSNMGLNFLGEENIEEIDKQVLEGADAVEHQTIDAEQGLVSYGAGSLIEETKTVRLEYTIRLFNLEKDTSISLRLDRGHIGYTQIEFYNYNTNVQFLVHQRYITYLGPTLFSLSDNDFLSDSDSDGLGDGEERFEYGTNLMNVDSDGDGLNDGEEVYKYYTDPAVQDADSDTDGDGMTNVKEVDVYGTDPLVWDAITGTDTDSDGLSDEDEKDYGTDPLDSDTDNDGLLDGYEINQSQTNPKDPDTDGDKMTDKWEVDHGLDPKAWDNDLDFDNDGLSNGEEFTHKTDPHNRDTDVDDMPDGWEVDNGLDPKDKDADFDPDQDGLTNGIEYTYQTNPKNSDTDGDDMPDGWEITHELNPKVRDDLEDPDVDGLTNKEEFEKQTNPQKEDTDGDGTPDGRDPKPLVAETLYFGRSLEDLASIAGIVGGILAVIGFLIKFVLRREKD